MCDAPALEVALTMCHKVRKLAGAIDPMDSAAIEKSKYYCSCR